MAQPNREERGKLYRGNWDALNFDRRAPEFFWEIFCAQCDKAITRDYIIESPTNPATKPAECSLGWYYDRRFNSCYKVVTPNSSILDFNSANEVCQNASAQLASIHSAEENELIVALASDLSLTVSVISYQTLLGARRVDNTWTWTDGTPFDYNNILTDADYNYIPCLQLWATNTTVICFTHYSALNTLL
ncbi:unnamed protein product, partial [Mesorhabditis belari]|uniref:C-type lectin domain-containing protein n=1 Tax=Mesorhabditis belari TaxID=2138241 RepID=A0AAF3EC23_9BILA